MDGPPSTPACLCAGDWGRYRYLSLEGESFPHMCPMSLRIIDG